MIQSYIESPVALTSKTSSVSITTDSIRSRGATCAGWLQHSEGSPIYKILEGGLYEVTFNANVTSATAGPVALSLLVDGLPAPGATAIETVVTPGDYSNVAFTKKIKICCRGDASLSIASIPSVLTGATLPGTATDTVVPIIQNANFSITRKG